MANKLEDQLKTSRELCNELRSAYNEKLQEIESYKEQLKDYKATKNTLKWANLYINALLYCMSEMHKLVVKEDHE